jgi:hypothetical protein
MAQTQQQRSEAAKKAAATRKANQEAAEAAAPVESTPVGGEVPLSGVAASGKVPPVEQDKELKKFVKKQEKGPGEGAAGPVGKGAEKNISVHPSEIPTKPKDTELYTYRSRYDFSSSLVLVDKTKIPFKFVDRTFTISPALANHYGVSVIELVEAMERDTHMKRQECIQVAGPGFVADEATIKFERQVHQYLAENKQRIVSGSRATVNE